MPTKPIEAQTALPLHVPVEPVRKDEAIQKVLDKLYELAVGGNLTAAKIYLDFSLKSDPGESEGISNEDVLKLIQEHVR